MKVGILTFNWANNYGAILQTFALYESIKEIGHDPIIIDRRPEYKGLLRKLYHRFSYKHHYSWKKFHAKNNGLFEKTKPFFNQSDIKQILSYYKLDAIIVGSDQVWRWLYIAGFNYFLDFIEDPGCRKISYAASFGLSTLNNTNEDNEKIASLLKKFYKISVREKSGVAICKSAFGVEATQVVDPTMLHDCDFYIKKFNLKETPVKGNLITYLLGEEANDLILQAKKYAITNNLNHVELNRIKLDTEIPAQSSCPMIHYTLNEWLNYIYNADIIITNSFHATVFSILFRKSFYVLNNKKGGFDRIITILSSLDLEDRIIKSIDDINDALPDYGRVIPIMNSMSRESKDFLIDSLN